MAEYLPLRVGPCPVCLMVRHSISLGLLSSSATFPLRLALFPFFCFPPVPLPSPLSLTPFLFPSLPFSVPHVFSPARPSCHRLLQPYRPPTCRFSVDVMQRVPPWPCPPPGIRAAPPSGPASPCVAFPLLPPHHHQFPQSLLDVFSLWSFSLVLLECRKLHLFRMVS